jgi:hypothetical protein
MLHLYVYLLNHVTDFHETWFEDCAVEEQTNAYLFVSHSNL